MSEVRSTESQINRAVTSDEWRVTRHRGRCPKGRIANQKSSDDWLPTSRLDSGGDVGLLEILPSEEERLAGDLGERIGEAIAEIQPGGVAALAEVEESLPRQVRLLDGDGFDDNAGSAEKSVALTASVRANLTFNDDGELDEVCGTHQAAVGAVDELGVEGGFGFSEKDGGKCRRGITWGDRVGHRGIRRGRDRDL